MIERGTGYRKDKVMKVKNEEMGNWGWNEPTIILAVLRCRGLSNLAKGSFCLHVRHVSDLCPKIYGPWPSLESALWRGIAYSTCTIESDSISMSQASHISVPLCCTYYTRAGHLAREEMGKEVKCTICLKRKCSGWSSSFVFQCPSVYQTCIDWS